MVIPYLVVGGPLAGQWLHGLGSTFHVDLKARGTTRKSFPLKNEGQSRF